MPKKTRKEKIIAAYRKRLISTKTETTPDKVVAKVQGNQLPIESKSQEKMPNTYFSSDMKKSLLLTFVMIALEIALYYARLIK